MYQLDEHFLKYMQISFFPSENNHLLPQAYVNAYHLALLEYFSYPASNFALNFLEISFYIQDQMNASE